MDLASRFNRATKASPSQDAVPKRLLGKVAIVTGAGGGIGAAIAVRLAQEGCKLMLTDIDYDAAVAAVARAHKAYQLAFEVEVQVTGKSQIRAMPADLTNESEVKALVAETAAKFGRVDILVNNAAVFVFANALQVTDAELDKAFATNVKGYAFATKHAGAAMVNNKGSSTASGGSVINMCSISAQIAQPGFVPYSMTKGAIAQMTRNAALDLGKYGIRVNAINPGPILTEGTARQAASEGRTLDEMTRELTSHLVMGRMGRPEEVAAVVAFLACDDSSFCTGSTITVDGGYTIT